MLVLSRYADECGLSLRETILVPLFSLRVLIFKQVRSTKNLLYGMLKEILSVENNLDVISGKEGSMSGPIFEGGVPIIF